MDWRWLPSASSGWSRKECCAATCACPPATTTSWSWGWCSSRSPEGCGRPPAILAHEMSDVRPIGVFDSGVGGLTVLRELHRQLPGERLVYLADLAHFPYGPRYQDEVRSFAHRIIDYLSSLDVKLVGIACNTATAAALHSAREIF